MAQTTGGKPIMVSMPQGTSSKTVTLSQASASGKPVTIQMPAGATQGQTLTLVPGSSSVTGTEAKDTSSEAAVPETGTTVATTTLEDKGQVDGAIESLFLEHSTNPQERLKEAIIDNIDTLGNEEDTETEIVDSNEVNFDDLCLFNTQVDGDPGDEDDKEDNTAKEESNEASSVDQSTEPAQEPMEEETKGETPKEEIENGDVAEKDKASELENNKEVQEDAGEKITESSSDPVASQENEGNDKENEKAA